MNSKSFAVKGTVFWLVASAALISFLVSVPDSPAAAEFYIKVSGLVISAVYVVVAYACWKLRRWGFIAAIILSLFIAVGSIAGGFYYSATVTQVFPGESMVWAGFVLVPQTILIFFSYRAYREGKTSEASVAKQKTGV